MTRLTLRRQQARNVALVTCGVARATLAPQEEAL